MKNQNQTMAMLITTSTTIPAKENKENIYIHYPPQIFPNLAHYQSTSTVAILSCEK